jgi:hypothetical protein
VSKGKNVGKRSVALWTIVLLMVTVWVALGDSEMTGQQVRPWRLVKRGWEVRLDV